MPGDRGPMIKRRDVALVISMDTSYGRDVLRGVASFRRENPWFRVRSLVGSTNAQSVLARTGPFDGVLGHLNIHGLVEYSRQVSRRVVSVSNALESPGVARVVTDDVEMGRRVAAHLAECGLPRIAMLPERFSYYVGLRAQGFREEAARRGVDCALFEGNAGAPFTRVIHGPIPVESVRWDDKQTSAWLAAIPRPFGLAVTTESLAFVAMDQLLDLGFAIPNDAAVVACGYDRLFSDVTPVALSGIALPATEIGYAACELLARMMSGDKIAPDTCITLPPGPLHLHASSDLMHSEDELVGRVLKIFDERAFTPISFKQISDELGAARRTVESRFQKALGRSPMQEVLRRRLLRAESLLREGDFPLDRVARTCGFTEARFLIRAFRQKHGTTPGAYRKLHRHGATIRAN
jgi:LacI family transcriptional regulator